MEYGRFEERRGEEILEERRLRGLANKESKRRRTTAMEAWVEAFRDRKFGFGVLERDNGHGSLGLGFRCNIPGSRWRTYR